MIRCLPVLASLLLLTACGAKVELYGDLREREANEMLSLMLRAGIAAEKIVAKGGVVTLKVDQDRVPDAIDMLSAAGLPRDKFANIGDLFKKEGLISSPSEERVRYIYGTTQELSRTLTGIDGVLSARVHVVLPNNDPVGQQAKPASAAVLIRYAPGAAIEAAVPKIKELVVNSIEGLSYNNVSVVLVRAAPEGPPPRMAAEHPSGAAGLPMAAIYGLGGALALSVAGNAALSVLLWWRRRPREQAMISVTT